MIRAFFPKIDHVFTTDKDEDEYGYNLPGGTGMTKALNITFDSTMVTIQHLDLRFDYFINAEVRITTYSNVTAPEL